MTELLEDFQKIISVQVDENDEKTLEIVSKDFKTLQTLWNKFRQEGPGQTLAGRKVDFGTFFYLLVILLWITHPWVYNIIQERIMNCY